MGIFDFSKKKRLKKEQERLEQERLQKEHLRKQLENLEKMLNDLEDEYKKKIEKEKMWKDYINKSKKYSEYDYNISFDDDFYQKYFDKKYGDWGEYSYDRNNQKPTINSSTALDKSFQLMKLNKYDSETVIKKRYRELSIKWHPDKWSTNTVENQAIAGRNFVKLNNAYELIKKYKNIK